MDEQDNSEKNKNHTTFEFEDKTYKVMKPNNRVRRESDAYYAKAYRTALNDNFLLNAEIDEILENRGFSKKQAGKKKNERVKLIRELEVKLVKNRYKNKQEGKDISFEIQDLRDSIVNIDSAQQELESQSVERHAENRRFSYFAYRCCIDEDSKQLWGDFEEFEDDESALAIKAATELLMLVYDITQDSQKDILKDRTETRWLRDNGYMNGDLQLIDNKNRMIDREGRLINKEGDFLDEGGHKVDIYGNKIDDEGRLIFDKPKKAAKKSPSLVKTVD